MKYLKLGMLGLFTFFASTTALGDEAQDAASNAIAGAASVCFQPPVAGETAADADNRIASMRSCASSYCTCFTQEFHSLCEGATQQVASALNIPLTVSDEACVYYLNNPGPIGSLGGLGVDYLSLMTALKKRDGMCGVSGFTDDTTFSNALQVWTLFANASGGNN